MTRPPLCRVGRRVFLKVAGTTTAAIVVPLSGCDGVPAERGAFFDALEQRTLEAALALLVPESREARAWAYVDALLSAFDHDPPRIFAGGPYSGRHPFGDPSTGLPSDALPPDDFSRFLPLSPARELAWRIRLFGSASVEGGDFNDAVLGPVRGWREVYREGLARLDAAARDMGGTELADAPAATQEAALRAVGTSTEGFYPMLFEHAIEGTYGDPVYGGNADQVGWLTTRWDGDSQPLGHSVWTPDGYVDLAERPTSTADPGSTDTFSRETRMLLDLIVAGTGGQRFFP